MSYFYPGDRVVIFAHWSSFYRQQGTVNATTPHLMVTVDGDTYPMRMGERECIRIDDAPEPMTAGGE